MPLLTSALELAITPDMGHGWVSDVAHSNIHERYLFTLLFDLYKNSKVSMVVISITTQFDIYVDSIVVGVCYAFDL